ncbi:MAG: YebC/PmpR family DNA-binding transcriptional regulator [SAR324 cluster bacterium]|nr:YebC/PmpR family DNA-binding transcriptional regulator [SAR324 cluster bacterium]
MSGHNKWSQIKHRKAAKDIKRSKMFTKVIKEITVAVKLGGEIVNNNFRLRSALEWAKAESMPADNVTQAIKKASKKLDTSLLEQITYEGYAPGKIAIIVECLTDNKNRTVANLRCIFAKGGGQLANMNSVHHLFSKVALLKINKSVIDEEKLLDIVLDAGANDINSDEDFFYVIADSHQLSSLHQKLTSFSIAIVRSEIIMLPNHKITPANEEEADKAINLLQVLKDDDDVQKVFTNLKFDGAW